MEACEERVDEGTGRDATDELGAARARHDAILAMTTLGFTKTDAQRAVREALASVGAGASIERLVRSALQHARL